MSPSCRVSSFIGRVHQPIRLPTALASRSRPATKSSSLGTSSPHGPISTNSIARCYHHDPYPEPRVAVSNTYVSPYVRSELKYDPSFFDKRRNFQRNAISKQLHNPPPRKLNPDYLNLEGLNKEQLEEIVRAKKRESDGKPKSSAMDYCLAEPVRDEAGKPIWPAPVEAMEEAREFIKECAQNGKRVVIAPDKDADGLTSGVILYRTLVALGLPESNITVHLISKGHSIHDDHERDALTALDPTHLIVLDQGSRGGPAILPSPTMRTLIIDHHQSALFPSDALILTACAHPPIATTSLLTWVLLRPPAPTTSESTAYLACIGTHGDLGNTLKWLPPFPDMTPVLKQHTKKAIHAAIPLLNAPRRTARYDVRSAWDALLASENPSDLRSHARLSIASAEVRAETERCTHTPPKFSRDGKIAVLRIKSEAQVHPVIATRWAGYLRSQRLEIVMCANEGYQEGMVNFSCRRAKGAISRLKNEGREVDIIRALEEAAELSTEGLRERLGHSFARGHREASGGIVPVREFEELMGLLGVGEKVERNDGDGSPEKKKKTLEKTPQKNTLASYFKMGGSGAGGGGDGEKKSAGVKRKGNGSPKRNGSAGPASDAENGEAGSQHGEEEPVFARDVKKLQMHGEEDDLKQIMDEDQMEGRTPTDHAIEQGQATTSSKKKKARKGRKSASRSSSEAASSETDAAGDVEKGTKAKPAKKRRKKAKENDAAAAENAVEA